jgi:hypothetical protein
VDWKNRSQQENSTDKLSDYYKLTIARRRRVVGESHDEEADVQSIQRRFAGWEDPRSNVQTSKTRNNCQKKQCNDKNASRLSREKPRYPWRKSPRIVIRRIVKSRRME